MKIQELNDKAVCIVGYGREGQAMHRALQTFAPQARITIADANEAVQASDATLQTGPDYLEGLEQFDAVIQSPGLGHHQQLTDVGDRLTSATTIFFDTIADSGAITIGITGSKGKSTTTNLIYHALKAHYPQTFIMGNVGIPMIDYIAKAQPGSYLVIELSSYQLEYATRSPHIAVLTNLFAEHLDHHGSIGAYFAAKQHIADFQTADDIIFYNGASSDCATLAAASPGKQIPFTADDFPLPVSRTKLQGEHNRSNLAAAYKVALHCGVPEATALQALCETDGLPYRLHNLGTHHGLVWVDDSLATAPEASSFALDALGDTVDTLITGGMDRGMDFGTFGARIASSAIRNLILFPDSGAAIKQVLGRDMNILETSSMAEAVAFAKTHTQPGKTVLLSNASPSYNLFKNHEDKSAQFVQAITA